MTDNDWTAEQIGALIRQCFVADEGRQLVSVDFSQIEARVLLWLAGDEEGLEVFRRFDAKAGPDAYCVVATKMFGEPVTKEDPRRQAGKVATLGAGFGAGPDALDRYAAKQNINLADAGTTSLAVVEGWRRATPLVAGREIGKTFVDEKGRERQVRRGGLWRELESAARDAIQGGDGSPWWRFDGTDLYLLLPSGRAMRYRHARVEAHEKHGKVKDTILFFNPEKNRRVATYGGKLTENLVQAVARDLLADAMVRVEEVAPIVMHTHDNIVAESDRPEEHLAEILQIMTTPPAWAAGLPVGADGHFGRRFTK